MLSVKLVLGLLELGFLLGNLLRKDEAHLLFHLGHLGFVGAALLLDLGERTERKVITDFVSEPNQRGTPLEAKTHVAVTESDEDCSFCVL